MMIALQLTNHKSEKHIIGGEIMPVFSYVAIPCSGKKNELLEELNSFNNCEATPSDNKDVLILVTDSPDKETEASLQQQLKELHSLESLHMSFGCNDEIQ